jgi:hypothetical protein
VPLPSTSCEHAKLVEAETQKIELEARAARARGTPAWVAAAEATGFKDLPVEQQVQLVEAESARAHTNAKNIETAGQEVLCDPTLHVAIRISVAQSLRTMSHPPSRRDQADSFRDHFVESAPHATIEDPEPLKSVAKVTMLANTGRSLGLTLDAELNFCVVTDVEEGGQAARQHVKVGMLLLCVGGETITHGAAGAVAQALELVKSALQTRVQVSMVFCARRIAGASITMRSTALFGAPGYHTGFGIGGIGDNHLALRTAGSVGTMSDIATGQVFAAANKWYHQGIAVEDLMQAGGFSAEETAGLLQASHDIDRMSMITVVTHEAESVLAGHKAMRAAVCRANITAAEFPEIRAEVKAIQGTLLSRGSTPEKTGYMACLVGGTGDDVSLFPAHRQSKSKDIVVNGVDCDPSKPLARLLRALRSVLALRKTSGTFRIKVRRQRVHNLASTVVITGHLYLTRGTILFPQVVLYSQRDCQDLHDSAEIRAARAALSAQLQRRGLRPVPVLASKVDVAGMQKHQDARTAEWSIQATMPVYKIKEMLIKYARRNTGHSTAC